MFKNRVLRRIFGPKRDEVTEEWGKLHNKELNGMCSSPYIVRDDQIENGMGGAFSIYGGEKRFWLGNLRESEYLEVPCVGGRIIS